MLKVSAPTTFNRLHITPHLPAFLARYPDIEIDMHLTDAFVDIIREGFDLAIRIGELKICRSWLASRCQRSARDLRRSELSGERRHAEISCRS